MCGGVDHASLNGDVDNKCLRRLQKIASLIESSMKSKVILTRQCKPLGKVVKRNLKIIYGVNQVALAGESRKVYMPSPLKRWYGIKCNHIFQIGSCVFMIAKVIFKQVKQAKALHTYYDNAVIHL